MSHTPHPISIHIPDLTRYKGLPPGNQTWRAGKSPNWMEVWIGTSPISMVHFPASHGWLPEGTTGGKMSQTIPGPGDWRLLSHRSIPYASQVEARVALRCDHRGCIAFGKQLDAMRWRWEMTAKFVKQNVPSRARRRENPKRKLGLFKMTSCWFGTWLCSFSI